MHEHSTFSFWGEFKKGQIVCMCWRGKNTQGKKTQFTVIVISRFISFVFVYALVNVFVSSTYKMKIKAKLNVFIVELSYWVKSTGENLTCLEMSHLREMEVKLYCPPSLPHLEWWSSPWTFHCFAFHQNMVLHALPWPLWMWTITIEVNSDVPICVMLVCFFCASLAASYHVSALEKFQSCKTEIICYRKSKYPKIRCYIFVGFWKTQKKVWIFWLKFLLILLYCVISHLLKYVFIYIYANFLPVSYQLMVLLYYDLAVCNNFAVFEISSFQSSLLILSFCLWHLR